MGGGGGEGGAVGGGVLKDHTYCPLSVPNFTFTPSRGATQFN